MKQLQNPVVRRLKSLVESGTTTYEKLCVALDIRYYCLASWIARDSISANSAQLLFMKKIITQEDYNAYKLWKEKKRSQRTKSKKRDSSVQTSDNQSEETGESFSGGD